MGIFDGPGIRLVVFLQGCNFRCIYCANPDTIDLKGDAQLIDEDEILRKAISEKPFFGKRGGVTFSGGEPTLQAKELIPLVKGLKENNIHVVVDTNGAILNEQVKELFKYVDMVLLDVKGVDKEKHQLVTKRRNDVVLQTAQYLEQEGITMRIRCVMVPGYNDSPEDIRLIGENYSHFTNIDRVEVLPYHKFGVHKYEALGWEYELEGVKEHTPQEVDALSDEFKKYFPNVWTQ